MEDHLNSTCFDKVCINNQCPEAVKQAPTGRWYITMGHAGFNSKANNGLGYPTKKRAMAAMQHYLGKSAARTTYWSQHLGRYVTIPED